MFFSDFPPEDHIDVGNDRIITPTIIEQVSFRAWLEEAFGIWHEWQRVYPPNSPTAKTLSDIRRSYWLVNVIHHAYVEPNVLWDLLLEE